MNNQNKVLKRFDVLLIVIIVLTFLTFHLQKSSVGQSIEVLIEGKIVMRIKAPGSYELRSGDKYLMRIVFNGYELHVEDSNCPDKICEKTGKIKSGGAIICVPNKVLIRLKKSAHSDVDVMTW